MKSKLFFLTIALTAAAFTASANSTDPTNGEESKKTDITGGVVNVDTKKPIGNVSVTAYSAAKKEKVVYTDANGNYSFDELRAGTYRLVFEKTGYKKLTKEKVLIRPDEGCQLNVEMDNEDEMQILPGSLFNFD
ncbi:MAG TPA: carboxypeptidase-like regulatory domain-containing protein [Flavisolibacter sp.]|jgi:5-hydroxyisourate hydrolase-like protein (transthyretin family)|nr:carboxypeptidase-like regulatory domain-containing protein [Flavisolibacter sp.]